MDSKSAEVFDSEFEKRINGSRLLPVSDIERPIVMVCLVHTPDGTGSGFLAELDGYKFILTNNHVIPNNKAATTSRVFFDYKDTNDRIMDMLHKGITLDPDSFFFTSPDLDFTAVGYRDAGFIIHARESRCYVLDTHSTTVKIGLNVEVYQHPDGKPIMKSTGVISVIDGSFISYNATTDYGSSGGLILDGNMTLVALHHERVLGKELNKGILMSDIVENLRKQMEAKKLSGQPIGNPSTYALDPALSFFAQQFNFVLTPEEAEKFMKNYLNSERKSSRAARVINIQKIGLFSAQTIITVNKRYIVAMNNGTRFPIEKEDIEEIPNLWNANLVDNTSIYIPISQKSKLISCLRCHGTQNIECNIDSSWGSQTCNICTNNEKIQYNLELHVKPNITIRTNKRIFVPQIEIYPEELKEAVRSTQDRRKLFEIADVSINRDDLVKYNLPNAVIDSVVERLCDIRPQIPLEINELENSVSETENIWKEVIVDFLPIYIIKYQENSNISTFGSLWLIGNNTVPIYSSLLNNY